MWECIYFYKYILLFYKVYCAWNDKRANYQSPLASTLLLKFIYHFLVLRELRSSHVNKSSCLGESIETKCRNGSVRYRRDVTFLRWGERNAEIRDTLELCTHVAQTSRAEFVSSRVCVTRDLLQDGRVRCLLKATCREGILRYLRYQSIPPPLFLSVVFH